MTGVQTCALQIWTSYTEMIEGAMMAMRAELTARRFLRDALLAEVKLMELAGGTFPGVAPFMRTIEPQDVKASGSLEERGR